jgi:hypothetical protein
MQKIKKHLKRKNTMLRTMDLLDKRPKAVDFIYGKIQMMHTKTLKHLMMGKTKPELDIILNSG